MKNKIEIYKTADNNTEINVHFDEDTVWLNRQQMSHLFKRDIKTIGKHINNIFKEGELNQKATVANFATVQKEGERNVERSIEHYNLDVIISVGYRVKSQRGTQFRQWATRRLKDYLVQGYAINEKRLVQQQQEIKYLKTGISIARRTVREITEEKDRHIFHIFAKGLALLDDFDHEQLDKKGKSLRKTIFPDFNEYMELIQEMHSEFNSSVFAKPINDSFNSSINQIGQIFNGQELYPTIEEKAANLLYFITKNHSFADGNKRIAAACFVYFLQQNKALLKKDGQPVIDNDTLAALTLFIAASRPDEADTVKRLTISILNRNK